MISLFLFAAVTGLIYTGVAEGAISAKLQLKAMEVDWSLHVGLTGALNNPVALATYDENRYRLSVMQHSRRPLPERIVPAMTEHLQIMEHIQGGEAEQAVPWSELICRKRCAGGVLSTVLGKCSRRPDKGLAVSTALHRFGYGFFMEIDAISRK